MFDAKVTLVVLVPKQNRVNAPCSSLMFSCESGRLEKGHYFPNPLGETRTGVEGRAVATEELLTNDEAAIASA